MNDPQPKGPYFELPESIKGVLSQTEYLWLSEEEKARLIQQETEPDPEP